MFIAPAMCSCLVLQLQSAEVSGTVTSSLNKAGLSVFNVNEGIQGPES
jgi:hypothetical protein